MRNVDNIKQKAGACIVILLFLVLSCVNQSDEDQGASPFETGSASFSVNWNDDVTGQSEDTAPISTQPANKTLAQARSEDTVSITQTESDICEVVTEVSCEVYDASGNDLTSASFECSAHTGTVRHIPAGPNREFVILGVDALGYIWYQGRLTGTIISGQTRDLGEIDAHPFYVSTLLSPLDGAEAAEGFSLSWEACENAAAYRVQVSDQIDFSTLVVNATTTGTSYQPTGLSVSTAYYWQVFPIDNHSNQGAPSEEVWQFTVVEEARPCTYSLSPSSMSFTAEGGNGSVSVTASGSDCQWSVSSVAGWLSITSASSFTGSGTVTYTVSENTTEDSRTATLTITGDNYSATHSVSQDAADLTDVTPPTVTITSPTSDDGYNTSEDSLDISGTASDDVGVTRVTWSNDRGGGGDCTGATSWSVSGISLFDGVNIITVTAQDAAGNTSPDTLTVTKTEDTPPIIAFTSPTTGSSYETSQGSLSISGTASDDVGISQVTWTNDRGGSGACTGTTNWSASGIALYEGTNVITATAQDTAGNTASAILTVNSPIDELPTVTINTPSSTGSYNTQNDTLSIGGTASDDEGIAQVTWTNDKGGNGSCTGTTDWSASDIELYEGTNIITVTAEDSSGGTGSDTLTVTYTPLETIPTVDITDPTSNDSYTTTQSTLNIGGNASDDVGVTEVRWANGQESSGVCTGTTNWSTSITLIQGINLITVTAYDAAGNTGFDSLTVTYTPLETLPSVTITDPTTSSTYDATQSTLNISGTASDGSGITEVKWENDRGGSGACTGTTSWSVSGITLYEGANVITIRAYDTGGNVGTDSLTVYYGQVVNFPDSGLEAAVRAEINKPTGDITTTDLTGMTSLDAAGYAITDLEGLQYCTKLTSLELDSNYISDISQLAGLTQLTQLYLGVNQISNLSPLTGLTNLTYLSLYSNNISDISPLVDNAGIDSGDTVDLLYNYLSETSCGQMVPLLEDRGVTVYNDCY